MSIRSQNWDTRYIASGFIGEVEMSIRSQNWDTRYIASGFSCFYKIDKDPSFATI
jgi:hypothetical protein